MKATVTAYAKINLLLDVLRKRQDGYHEVSMVMQAITLSDTLTLEPGIQNSLHSNRQTIPLDQRNLAMKALLLMQHNFPQIPKMEIYLEKKIPVAAGLAGGSTDAAAVLLGLNHMFELALSSSELEKFAAELGSDVPFCVAGPTAIATGRGEKIQALSACPKLYFVLVKPSFGVSTPKVYQNLQVAQLNHHPDWNHYLDALKKGRGEEILSKMENVLETSTFSLKPAVAALKEELKAAGAHHVLMSGSGPTVFAGFMDKAEAKQFYHKIATQYGQVFFTETTDSVKIQERVKLS